MEIVNFFNCRDHYEARKKEQEYFELLNATLNSMEPMPKPKPKVVPTQFLEVQETNYAPNAEMPKNAGFFVCETCHFKCSKLSNYNQHLLTRKHQKNEISNQKIPKNPKNGKKIVCEVCNKSYKDNSGLWRHKKKCIKTDEEKEEEPKKDNDLVLLLLKENQEFKQMLLEQNKQLLEIVRESKYYN
jgi:hypothetical protein